MGQIERVIVAEYLYARWRFGQAMCKCDRSRQCRKRHNHCTGENIATADCGLIPVGNPVNDPDAAEGGGKVRKDLQMTQPPDHFHQHGERRRPKTQRENRATQCVELARERTAHAEARAAGEDEPREQKSRG